MSNTGYDLADMERAAVCKFREDLKCCSCRKSRLLSGNIMLIRRRSTILSSLARFLSNSSHSAASHKRIENVQPTQTTLPRRRSTLSRRSSDNSARRQTEQSHHTQSLGRPPPPAAQIKSFLCFLCPSPRRRRRRRRPSPSSH